MNKRSNTGDECAANGLDFILSFTTTLKPPLAARGYLHGTTVLVKEA